MFSFALYPIILNFSIAHIKAEKNYNRYISVKSFFLDFDFSMVLSEIVLQPKSLFSTKGLFVLFSLSPALSYTIL